MNEYSGLKNTRPEGVYVKVLGSDGTFRVEVPEGTPDAVERTYEIDDVKKTKTELVFHELTGIIEDIQFRDTDYGRTINLSVRNDKSLYIVSINTANNYASSLMKRLPVLDLTKEMVLKPYSFDNDEGKKVSGISVQQGGEKIEDFFYDKEKKKNINNFPVNDEKKKPEATAVTKWKKYWRAYFSDVEEFLVDHTEKNVIPNVPKAEADEDFEEWGKDGEESARSKTSAEMEAKEAPLGEMPSEK